MQEQQGSLEEPLSRLPGPRPFNKKNKKGTPMENKNEHLTDIVAKTAEALGSGKAFGGWTDTIEQTVKQGPPIKIKLGKGKKIGSRVADIGPGGKEHNVKTDAAWDAHQKKVDKGKIRQGKWGDSVEKSSDGEILNERTEGDPKYSHKVKIGKPIPMRMSTTPMASRSSVKKPRQLKNKKKVDN